jgi:hypothetical protein
MAASEDTRCPFCAARIDPADQACPACDLPLLGADGSHPQSRSPAPFDGAALFDAGRSGESRRRTATERRVEAGEKDTLRCVVVALNQAEADMLCDMLRAEGVPCLVRPPELQSYAQHSLRCEVMVPARELPVARALLRMDPVDRIESAPAPSYFTLTLLLVIVAAAALVALAVTLVS